MLGLCRIRLHPLCTRTELRWLLSELASKCQAAYSEPPAADTPNTLFFRMWLSYYGGGGVNGTQLAAAQCDERALELENSSAFAWNALGFHGGGRVQGIFYSPKSCFEKALELNPKDANAWCNLGNLGGNARYLEMACYLKALAVDPKNAFAWYNLGLKGGLQGKTEGQCFRKAKREFQRKLQADAASLRLECLRDGRGLPKFGPGAPNPTPPQT